MNQCDLKYFIEIDQDICKSRRASRVWDPEGSCWEESAEYFQLIAWPEYQKCVTNMKNASSDITFLESNTKTIKDNFDVILADIIEKIRLNKN